MTCIAVIGNKISGKSWIAGDSCITRGDAEYTSQDPKIALRNLIPLPEEAIPDKETLRTDWLVKHWAEPARDFFEA